MAEKKVEKEKKGCLSTIFSLIVIILVIGFIVNLFSDAGGNVEIEGNTAYLDWNARMNLGDNSALKAIVHTMGEEIYNIAKKHDEINEIQVSLYYVDLIDKYGNDIPTEEAFNNKFIIDELDEVRKYKDGLSYAMNNETFLAFHVISGEYSYLWKD